MKKIVTSVIVSLGLALNAQAGGYCEASSSFYTGWGESHSVGKAKRIAMHNCRANTPRWDTCFITYCDIF